MEQTQFIAEERVIPRLKQAFILYKNNFVGLTLLIFFYNIIAFVVSIGLWNKVLKNLTFAFGEDIELDIVSLFLQDTLNIGIIFVIVVIGFLSYIIFFIPIFVGTLKSIGEALQGEEIQVQDNLRYGITRFFDVMKVYWYIFQYVFLTPALILIAWLSVILLALIYDIEALYILWGLLLTTAICLWVIYGVYRWLRSTFRLYAAIKEENFTKQSFLTWLDETKGKLWRIFWNFVLVGLLTWIATGIFWVIINTVTWVNTDERMQDIERKIENREFNIEEITEDLNGINQLNVHSILNGILITLIESVGLIYITICSYLLYLRLSDEYKKPQEREVEEQTKNTEL